MSPSSLNTNNCNVMPPVNIMHTQFDAEVNAGMIEAILNCPSVSGPLQTADRVLGAPTISAPQSDRDRAARIVNECQLRGWTVEQFKEHYASEPVFVRDVTELLNKRETYRLQRLQNEQREALHQLLPSIFSHVDKVAPNDLTDAILVCTKRDRHLADPLRFADSSLKSDIPPRKVYWPRVRYHMKPIKRGFWGGNEPVLVTRRKLENKEAGAVKQHLKNCIQDGTPFIVVLTEKLKDGFGHAHVAFDYGANLKWILWKLEKNSRLKYPTAKVILVKQKQDMAVAYWLQKLARGRIYSLDQAEDQV